MMLLAQSLRSWCRHKMRCLVWNLPVLPVHLLGLDTNDSILILKTYRSNRSFAMVFMFLNENDPIGSDTIRCGFVWDSEEWTFHCLIGLPKDRGMGFPLTAFPHGSRCLVQHLGIQPKADLKTFPFPAVWKAQGTAFLKHGSASTLWGEASWTLYPVNSPADTAPWASLTNPRNWLWE